jgi:hypothetical protein
MAAYIAKRKRVARVAVGCGYRPVSQAQRNSLDLTDEWAFQPVDGLADASVAALAAKDVDDARWERRRLGIWSLPDHPQVRRAGAKQGVDLPHSRPSS